GGTTSVSYSQSISASGGTTPYTFSVSGSLPNGLSLDSSTGAITGTPMAAGNFNFTIKVTDNNGCFASQAYSIMISCSTITINQTSLSSGMIGVAYSQTITASGGTGSYTFTVSSGSLPPGLSLNSSTGVLSGTPTMPGMFSFTIKATDGNGCFGTQ